MSFFAIDNLENTSYDEEILNINLTQDKSYNTTVLLLEKLIGEYYTEIEADNNPPNFIIKDNIPNILQLSSLYNKYANNIAVLCLYLLESYVYIWKKGVQNFDSNKTGSNGPNLTNLYEFFKSDESFGGFSKPIPKPIHEFVYTCVSKKTTASYGGFACEYTPFGSFKPSLFIVLRGTQTGPELYQDSRGELESTLYLKNFNRKVHKGFNTVYNSKGNGTEAPILPLKDQLINFLLSNAYKYESIIITGHSLGSALVFLLSSDLFVNYPKLINDNNINFYVNAGPYTGNQNFVDITNNVATNNITKVYSIINTSDPVPNDKLRTDYQRINSQLFFYTDPGSKGVSPHLPIIYITNVIKDSSIFQSIGTQKEVTAS